MKTTKRFRLSTITWLKKQGGAIVFFLLLIAGNGEKLSAQTPVPDAEYQALVALYNSTNGTGWTKQWTITANNLHLVSWNGVTVENGHITALDLRNNYLRGTLPEAMKELTKLKTLYLQGNLLTGTIPEEWSALTALSTLYLNNNLFSGKVPAFLNNLPELKSLSLNDNQFDDITAGGFSKITTFYLSRQILEREVFYYRGTDVTITLPDICRYNFTKRDLSATNKFYLRIDGSNVDPLIQASADGILTIPANFLKKLRKGQKISIYQNDGNAYTTEISYQTTDILLPPIPQSEYEALVTLCDSTTGPGWYNKWDTSANNFNEGSWYGVSVENGHITGINLQSNGLRGSIPAKIKDLVYLKELNLSGNYNLTGKIPAALGNLINLEILNLSSCQLSGNIPASLGTLSKLQNLYLNSNKLTGNIPTELGNLNELVILYLNSNLLSETIPSSLNLLPKLKTLELSGNALNNLSAGGFGSVTSINLSYQSLLRDTFYYTGTDVTIILPEICKYDFSKRDFSGKNSFLIQIAGNSVGDVTAAADGTLTIPAAYLKTLQKTQKVSIRQNYSGSAYYSTISYQETKINLPAIPQSEYEALVALYDSTSGAGWWNKWNVSVNNLHEGSWYGVSVENGHITSINLQNNHLTGSIPSKIKNLTYLRELYLSGNYLTGNIPVALGNLENLETLSLGSCLLSGNIPASLGSLSKLQNLYLNSNKLTGSIPAELGNLNELVNLYLNSNSLSGTIPSSLNLLPKLKFLDLSNNALDNLSAGGFGSITSSNFSYQSLSCDTFYYSGNDVIINLPEICRYNFPNRDFNGRYSFHIRIANSSVGDVQAAANGTLTIPAAYLKTLQKTQKISIQQNGNGAAYYSTISYQETKINMPAVPQSEYEALVALYDSTSGAGWYNKWNVSVNNLHEGSWYGISIENGHITGIDLNYNALKGSIPSKIKDLTSLKELNLSSNSNLTGSISTSVGNLTNLEVLKLNNCSLTGNIPATLGNLSKLQTLHLQSNKLAGNIPAELENMNELTGLLLQNNSLSGSIPATLNLLPKLKSLNISSNSIESLSAGGFANLTSFESTYMVLPRDTFYYTGNDVVINLPEICRYDFSKRDFSGQYGFQILVAGNSVGDVTAAADGTLIIPASFLKTVHKTQKVAIQQKYNGPAYYSTISYKETKITLPAIPQSEYEALVALYNATAGFNWTNKWNVNSNNLHEESWYGISIENGHITEIKLPNNNLRGFIPAEIKDLPYLKVLNLSGYGNNRYLTGSIPAEIGTLSELETLNLSYQKLSDSIPASIGNLSKIVTLDLRYNQLTGKIPASFANLSKVEYLYLQYNQLSDIGAVLPYRSSVTVNLNDQQIQDDLIFIAGNEITVNLPRICCYDHTGLTFTARNTFDIRVNTTVKGSIQATVGGQLLIPVNYFSGITHNDKVSIVQKSGMATGSVITYTDYDTGTPVADAEYQALIALYNAAGGANWKNKWNISQNNLHESFWYGVTTENGHITKIKLNGNNLQGEITEQIQNLPSLKELNLSDNSLTGNIPSVLGNLTNLTLLDLHNNLFEGNIPESLGNLNRLTLLYLYKNRLTSSIPQLISTISTLQDLQLHNNRLSGTIPEHLGNLSKLTVLNLSNNEFQGDVPSTLVGLSQLISLDLSFNQIRSLPATFNYGTGVSINLTNQQYDGESLLIDGTEVVVTLPNIATYHPETRAFNARNNFTIRLNNVVRGNAQGNANGTLTFPASYIDDFQEGDTISLVPYSGIAYGSVFRYYALYNTSSTPVPQSEYEALKAFFNATGGNQWMKTWNTATNNIHEGRWTGVSFREGHVTAINLSNNGLKGTIPAVLSNLPELTSVNLSSNELKGSIPETFNNLSRLAILDLSNNALDSMDMALSANITLKIGNQLINRGTMSLHKNTKVKSPKITTYNHQAQLFNQMPGWMISVNGKSITSINTASNGEFALTPPCGAWGIHPGDTLQFKQMSGNAAGSTVQYIIDSKYGDTNVDNVVNILDVQHALNRILGSNPCPFNIGTADVNKDGLVNILDLVGTINIIQTNALLNESSSLRSATGTPAELSIENGAVYLNSPVAVAAFDIRIQHTGTEPLSVQLPGFSSYVKEIERNHYSILFISLEGNSLPVGKTKLFDCPGNTNLTAAILSDKAAEEIPVRISGNQTGIDDLPAEAFQITNYPNPFRAATTFAYTLPETVSGAQIIIRKQTGNTMDILRNIPGNSGENRVEYHNETLPAGIYFYSFEAHSVAKTYRITKKLIVK